MNVAPSGLYRIKRRLRLGFAGALTIVGLSSVPAQSQSALELAGGVGFTTTGYSQDLADQFNLSTRSWGIQGTFAPRAYRYFTLLLEFGSEYWSQVCLQQPCETDRRSTLAFMASSGVGLASPVLFVDDPQGRVGFGLAAHVGYQWIWAGLSEDYCLNCTIDDLSVTAGWWIEPGLDLYADPQVVLGFSYRIFESGADVTGRFTLRAVYRAF